MKLYLIGGFLGSGKTTAILNAAIELIGKGIQVGVITNDQGVELVDTRFIKHANIPVMEVTDGCFCCNYDKLDDQIAALKESDHVEVIFAESVGSCTDMIATVVKPLEKFNKDIETVITVFVDANVLPTMLQGAPLFTDNVSYIYKKQIEEADLLVVNKIDSLSEVEFEKMKLLVGKKYPDKTTLFQNSLDESSINDWMAALVDFKTKTRDSLVIDYDVYAAGEAELAWLDLEIELFTGTNDAFGEGKALITEFHEAIDREKLAIGHLKFFIDDGTQQEKISFTAGTQSSLSGNRKTSSGKVDILINARVQSDPNHLESLLLNLIQEAEKKNGYKVVQKKLSSFKPGYPRPIHRIPD
ncbi:GTP-binding protein [Pedobacter foliorum]|uniref:GTP-binding protein n=1 Tax=Pedobacter foliorum TaxID=2739058 RepID=UPI001567AB9A|nr:GTP-binding protein [Pedobacter foliorum]NRF37335.1 hypothetical protein [Pedobacter foliorum]